MEQEFTNEELLAMIDGNIYEYERKASLARTAKALMLNGYQSDLATARAEIQPELDAKDAQIADLTAQVASLTAQLNEETPA